jgi:8-oxo-dGTP diphosphatase
MTGPKIIAAAVIRDGKAVLIGKRGRAGTAPGVWEFPGGKVEPREQPSEALAREIREELGCEIRVGRVLHVQTLPGVHMSIVFYECEIASGEPKNLVHEELKWAEETDLLAHRLHEADRKAASKIFKTA